MAYQPEPEYLKTWPLEWHGEVIGPNQEAFLKVVDLTHNPYVDRDDQWMAGYFHVGSSLVAFGSNPQEALDRLAVKLDKWISTKELELARAKELRDGLVPNLFESTPT